MKIKITLKYKLVIECSTPCHYKLPMKQKSQPQWQGPRAPTHHVFRVNWQKEHVHIKAQNDAHVSFTTVFKYITFVDMQFNIPCDSTSLLVHIMALATHDKSKHLRRHSTTPYIHVDCVLITKGSYYIIKNPPYNTWHIT